MGFKVLNTRATFLAVSFSFVGAYFFTGCMTSSKQEQLQSSIDKMQDEISKIQTQLSTKDQQINNTTQTALASQNEAQNLRDQLQLTQGAVDEVKNRLKKIEENAGTTSQSNSADVVNLSNNTASFATLQKQIARLELMSNSRLSYARKGKMPAKIKTVTDLNKTLKIHFENANFNEIVTLTTNILTAHDATDQMLAVALEYRGEARFQLQEYKGAATDLAGVTELFPNVPRKARALLLAGDSYVYLKNNPIALLYYDECARNFASTAEGKAAAARLSNLTAQMTSPSKESQP
ncbi:MAG: hypothetical protein V4591_05895 [Bdellovibrionota bacterium]